MDRRRPSGVATGRAGPAFWTGVLPALATAVVVRVVVMAADQVPTADATIYLTAGENLLSGDGYTRFGSAQTGLAPLVPVLLAALRRLTGDDTLAFGLHHLVWGTVLVLVVAGLAREVAGDRAGWRAAWAAALCPGLAVALSIDGGGSELPAVTALAGAAWLVVARDALPAGWRALAVGACCGLAYLFRADALPPALLLLAAMGVRLHRARPSGGAGWLVRPLAGATAVLLLLAAPWVAWLHTTTGELRVTAKAEETSIESWEALARHDRRARDAIAYHVDETGELAIREHVDLTQLAREAPGTFLAVERDNLETLAEEALVPEADFEGDLDVLPPTWELVPVPGLVLAGWAAWRRRREPRVRLLLGLAATNVAVALTFFVQDRYLGLSVVVACVLVGVGLAELRSATWRRALQGLLVVLALLAVLAELSGYGGLLQRNEPTEQRAVGQLLAATTDPDVQVMTRSVLVRHELGRATVAMPYASPAEVLAYGRRKGAELVVVDERLVASTRPQLAPWLGPGPWPGLTLRWELVVDGRLVRVFAIDRPLVRPTAG